MARKRQGNFIQIIDVDCGASDQDTSIATALAMSAHVPTDGAILVNAKFVQRSAGTGTGTIAAFLKAGTQTISDTISGMDADAAAETVHGQVDGQKPATPLLYSDVLKVNTVKTGSVTGDASLTIVLLWRL